MENYDVRWLLRLANYQMAFNQLKNGVEIAQSRQLSDLEAQGLIQSFEFTHELAWNVMKDFLEFQGITNIKGPRDAAREAFAAGLVADGAIWMEMIKSRNLSSHTYHSDTARAIEKAVLAHYFAAFRAFLEKMEELRLNKL